jgi:hypothetical protein
MALQRVNREKESVTTNKPVLLALEKAKTDRKQLIRCAFLLSQGKRSEFT